jgi:hypothetical protein
VLRLVFYALLVLGALIAVLSLLGEVLELAFLACCGLVVVVIVVGIVSERGMRR